MQLKTAALFIFFAFLTGEIIHAQSNSLKEESRKTLFVLAEALLKNQIHENGDDNRGAVRFYLPCWKRKTRGITPPHSGIWLT
jgi:hypothetical protein